MGITLPMRVAAIGLMLLFAVGMGWRGFAIYQADRRAETAASLVSATGKERTGASIGGTAAAGSAGASDGTAVGGSGPGAGGSGAGAGGAARTNLKVHVEGAVQKPGLYTLEAGARVDDAIQAAGGALPEGVPGALNLAAPVTDGSKVYVFTQTELQASTQPAPTSGGATYTPTLASEPPLAGTGGKTGSSGKSGKAGAPAPGSINVNSASAAELERVPGIGPATARAIIEYRTQHGPFQRLDSLVAVTGIGPKTLEKLRPYLTV